MPTYVYKFIDTDETIEVQQSFADDTLTEYAHPQTGATMPVKKVFLPVGVTFKGDGFYKTDNRAGKKSSSASSTSGGNADGDGGSSSDSSSSSGESSGSSSTSSSEGAGAGPSSSSSSSSTSTSPASSSSATGD